MAQTLLTLYQLLEIDDQSIEIQQRDMLRQWELFSSIAYQLPTLPTSLAIPLISGSKILLTMRRTLSSVSTLLEILKHLLKLWLLLSEKTESMRTIRRLTHWNLEEPGKESISFQMGSDQSGSQLS